MNWFRADGFLLYSDSESDANERVVLRRRRKKKHENEWRLCESKAIFVSQPVLSHGSSNKNRSAKIIIKMSLQDQKAINSTNYWCPNSTRNWIFFRPFLFLCRSLALFYFAVVVFFVCLFACSFQCIYEIFFFPPILDIQRSFHFPSGYAMRKKRVKKTQKRRT